MKKLFAIVSFFSGIILLLPLSLSCSAQATQRYTEIASVDCSGNMVRTDQFGRLYILNGSNLTCRDSALNVLYTYSDLSKGPFSSVDVTDPLKILLFSADFSTLTFLDQKLTVKGSPLNLQFMEVANASLCCSSYESGFWVYDASSAQLLRFNYLSQQVLSNNITALTGETVHPVFMTEIGNSLFISDTSSGIFEFDRYGGYIKMIPVKRVINILKASDRLLFCTPDDLIAYSPLDHTLTNLSLPEHATDVCTWRDRLILLNGLKLKIYRIL
jgi:hypothetical protein